MTVIILREIQPHEKIVKKKLDEQNEIEKRNDCVKIPFAIVALFLFIGFASLRVFSIAKLSLLSLLLLFSFWILFIQPL